MTLQLRDPELFPELEDIADDVLFAEVQAALPRFFRRWLMSRLPFAVAGIVLLAFLIVTQSDSSGPTEQTAQPARPSSGAGLAVDSNPTAPPTIPPNAIPSADLPPPVVPASPLSPPQPALPPPVTTTPPPTSSPRDRPGEPAGLTIIASGYASTLGGTPLEQEPADGGLPVQAGAGQTTRYSFVRLGGRGTQLRLALDTSEPPIAAEAADVDACPVVDADWEPTPGLPMSDGPAYDDGACVTAERLVDGTLLFDLASIGGGPARRNGIALVPSAASAPQSFSIVFVPTALGT